MFIKKILKSNNIYIFILIVFGILTHIEWFNPWSILNDSDWSFWTNEAVRELNVSFGSWVNMFNFGDTNIQIYFNIFKILWYILGSLGLSYDVATKITFLIPIAIGGFISPYILAKKIVKDNFIAFVGALFYGTTTYFLLRQTAHIPVAFIYMMAPIFIYTFIHTIENNKVINWIIFSLLNFVMIGYEIRMVYILYWIILIYWLVFFKKKYLSINYIKNYIIYGVSLILLNLYWILPTLKGSKDTIEATANRGLFGSFLFNIKRSITIAEASWTGAAPDINFIPQAVPIYLFIVPITIIIGLILFKLTKNKINPKLVMFFGIISLIGIILTNQESRPFTGLYVWMYQNFPGFNLFREASKFYMITAIGYLGLLSISIKLIKDNLFSIKLKKIYYVICVILISVFVYNTKPLLNREIQTMFVSKSIQEDYVLFKNQILLENESFRTFWTPVFSRYGSFNTKNSMLSNVWYLYELKDMLAFDENIDIENSLVSIYQKEYSNQLFDNSNIKYIIVPLEDLANDSDFFSYYGGVRNPNIRDWYIEKLDNISWLEKKSFGLKELVVYENKNYKDRIYLTKELDTINKDIEASKIEFKQVTPAEYRLKINSLNETQYLNFVEKYNSNWKLRVGDFYWKDVLYNQNYFIDDSKHTKSDINFNSFEVSKDYIVANFDESQYSENPDGSIDIELTLYFKPQAYFYLGIIVSLATLTVISGGLILYIFYNRRSRNSVL